MVIGCKFLRADGTSLNGQYKYDLSGKWNTVPGNGSYVAVTGGLTLAGIGDILVYLECDEPVDFGWYFGVQCFRKVRVIPPCPERIPPGLRGEVATCAPNLTPEQRMAIGHQCTPRWRGIIAYYANGLTADQRFELAMASTAYWRRMIGYNLRCLTAEQRKALLDSVEEREYPDLVEED
jgi:hypothetical protein